MNICMQLLLYVSVATPQERVQFREYWREQRRQFVKRHIIDDDPYDEQTQKIIDELEEQRQRRDQDAAE